MKKIELLFVAVFLIFILMGCNKMNNETYNKLNIVTSFYPMYIATSNIVEGVEDVELTNMTKTDVGCLHDYQLTTKDMNVLEKADVFIINGGGMESFLDKAISAYPALNIINSSDGIIKKHEIEEHSYVQNVEGSHEHKDGHHHGENSHIWVSISMYIEQVKNIANELSQIDETNKDKYISNANKYIEKLDSLKNEMHKELDDLENRNIITFHEAFEFFAEEFDLNVVAVIEREPGTSPSAGELAKIIETAKSTNATAIFVEPQYDSNIANIIATETNRPVYNLDPVVTGELSKDAYEKIMKENLEVLKEALK